MSTVSKRSLQKTSRWGCALCSSRLARWHKTRLRRRSSLLSRRPPRSSRPCAAFSSAGQSSCVSSPTSSGTPPPKERPPMSMRGRPGARLGRRREAAAAHGEATGPGRGRLPPCRHDRPLATQLTRRRLRHRSHRVCGARRARWRRRACASSRDRHGVPTPPVYRAYNTNATEDRGPCGLHLHPWTRSMLMCCAVPAFASAWCFPACGSNRTRCRGGVSAEWKASCGAQHAMVCVQWCDATANTCLVGSRSVPSAGMRAALVWREASNDGWWVA
eukprot:2233147-Prymnesium_polylepis.1